MAKTNNIGESGSPYGILASGVNGSPTTAPPTKLDVCPPNKRAIHRTRSSGTRISASPASTNSCHTPSLGPL